jgi:hypothetical protein
MWHIIIAGAILMLAACGENSDINPITPGGSFTVSGSVTDTAGRSIDQARIEVIDGPHAGVVTLSANGRFSFGVRRFTEGVTFQASKDGYHSAQEGVGPNRGFSDVNRSFQLASLTPSIDLTGSYLVTITADAACTSLPANATSRTYAATVTRSSVDWAYIGQLSGATFAPAPIASWHYDRFWANVSGTFVRFGFSNPDDYGIVEQLAPDAFVEFSGTADATVEAGTSSVEVPLSGSFSYCGAPRPNFFECTIPRITCTSTNHRLTLTRTGLP